MKLLVSMLSVFLFSTVSFADMELDHNHGKAPKKEMKNAKLKKLKKKARRICKKVDLTDDQKDTLKETRQEMRAEMKKLRPSLRKARKAYRKSLLAENATVKTADTAFENVIAARAKIRDLRVGTRHDILFDIVTEEQRPKMMRCMKARRQVRQYRKMHKQHMKKAKKGKMKEKLPKQKIEQ